MLWKSRFHFGDVARLSYGWDNPNYAAAVIVCVIPLFWAFESFKDGNYRRGLRVGEFALSIALALTYSRAAILGWVGALVYFTWCFSDWKRIFVPRIVTMAVILWGTGLSQRFILATEGDRSGTNRLELWIGGLKLVHASPLSGWGAGNAGWAFMQWVQAPRRGESYAGMLNMYIQTAVEYGVPIFALGLALLLFAVLIPATSKVVLGGRKKAVVCGCGAAIVTFAITGTFGSLVYVPSVVWAPCLALLAIMTIWVTSGLGFGRLAAVYSVAATTILTLGLFIAMHIAAGRSLYDIRRTKSGAVEFLPKAPTGSRGDTLVFMTDALILGPYFGKVIRESVQNADAAPRIVCVCPPGSIRPDHLSTGMLVVFGRRLEELHDLPKSSRLVLISPVGQPDSFPCLPRPELLVLPEFDELGYAHTWRVWAREHAISVLSVGGVGRDLRSQWDVVFKRLTAGS